MARAGFVARGKSTLAFSRESDWLKNDLITLIGQYTMHDFCN